MLLGENRDDSQQQPASHSAFSQHGANRSGVLAGIGAGLRQIRVFRTLLSAAP